MPVIVTPIVLMQLNHIPKSNRIASNVNITITFVDTLFLFSKLI